MTEYRFTFGLKYSRETHPQFPAAHPDGWLTILAAREEVARLIANAVLDRDWAFLYSGPFDEKWAQYHPMGELARIDASLTPVADQVAGVRAAKVAAGSVFAAGWAEPQL